MELVCIGFICDESVGIVYDPTRTGLLLPGRIIRSNPLIAFGIAIIKRGVTGTGTADAPLVKLSDAKSEALGNPKKTLKSMNKFLTSLFAIGMVAGATATAGVVNYANWTSQSGNTVNGTVGGVGVTYTGDVAFAQLNNTGTYWYTDPSHVPGTGTEYLSATVSNTPSTTDMIALASDGYVNTLTFSSPVSNPVMLLVSLGQTPVHTTYYFNTPFSILSDGPGWWGGPGILNNLGGSTLEGIEGDGTIQFHGSFSSISWTTSSQEYWNGFTIGTPVPDGGMTLTMLGVSIAGLSLLRRKL